MSETPTGQQPSLRTYEIRFAGHLHSRWAGWFDGLTVTDESDGTTLVEGPVADQAALHGLLRKLHDLGLPLLSVTRTGPDKPEAPPPTFATSLRRRRHHEQVRPARPSRAFHSALPLAGDRRLDRADARRRRRGREALDAVVPEHCHSRKAGLRGEPADTEGARSRPAAAEHRRLPFAARRRHQEPGGAGGDGAGREGEPRRAHELVLLDRQRDVRLARPAHDVPAGLPARARMRST